MIESITYGTLSKLPSGIELLSKYFLWSFTENGRYLGLDLGSTNFRVVLVDLKDGVAKTTTKYYNLTDDQLSGPAELVLYLYIYHFAIRVSNVKGLRNITFF